MAPALASVIRLHILGTFRVERDGITVADRSWRLRSARTMVKALAVDPSHAMHREALQDALWPHFEAAAAYNNFRKALHLARRALEPEMKPREPSRYLLLADDLVSLSIEHVWIDADQFETEARTAIEYGDAARTERALALYSGDLLAEDRYVEWAEPRREELRRLRLLLLSSLAERLEQQGAHAAATDRLHQILRVDPLHEGAQRGLMRAHALAGKRHEAVKQYDSYTRVLRRELDVDPDSETQALYESIVAEESLPVSVRRSDSGLPLSTLPRQAQRIRSGPLIGRTGDLKMLTRRLERTLQGTGGLIFISGEAGTGKSRLMAELATVAHADGAMVLWGTSYEEEALLPYGAVAEALDSVVSGWPEDDQAALAAKFPEVAPLMSSLPPGAVAAGGPSLGGNERTRLFAAVVRALTEIAAGRPLLIVLDDLHCADEGSLQLLHYLARSLESRPWLIVGAYRDEDVRPDAPLRALVRATARKELSDSVQIRGLNRLEANRLAHSLLGGAVDRHPLDRLFALSLGNPFFLQQLLIAMRDAGQVEYVGGAWKESVHAEVVIPTQVRELIDLRLERLDEDTRDALSLAAIIGMVAPLTVLRAASHLQEARLLHVLDAAMSARFLDEVEGGYTFRHPLFREVLRGLPSEARRAAMHRAVAEALERNEPNEVEALAYHFAQSGVVEQARRYYESAGDRAAAMYAHEVALSHYRDALQHCEEMLHRDDVARLTHKMADIHVIGGRYRDALDLWEQVVRLHGEDAGPEVLGTVAARIAYVHAMRGTPNEGADRVRSLLSRWDHVPASVEAALLLQLARLEEGGGRYADSLDAVQRALLLAAEAEDAVTVAEAESVRGHALLLLGRVDEATQAMKAAIPRAQLAGAESALTDLEGRLALIALVRGSFHESARYTRNAIARAEKLRDPVRVAIWGTVHALGASHSGNWLEARGQLEQCIALNEEIGAHHLTPYPLFTLGGLLVASGEWSEAHRVLAQAITLSEGRGNLQAHRWTARALAELHILEEQPQQALDLLTPLLDRPGVHEWEVTLLLPWVASAYRDLERPVDAMETIDRAIARARRQDGTVWLCEALPIRAGLLAAEQRHDEAEAEFSAACTLSRDIQYPLAEARALLAWGTTLSERGQRERAMAYLHEARSIFRRLDARRFEATTREALRGLTTRECRMEGART